MKNLSIELREWANGNKWYERSVLSNSLRLSQRFDRRVEEVAIGLEGVGRACFARRIEKQYNKLMAVSRAFDRLCEGLCQSHEEFVEIDFCRERVAGAVNSLADLLELMAKQCKGPVHNEYISFTEASEILAVNKGTVSRWANQQLLADNGKAGHSRKVLKSSVLMLKEVREQKELLEDVRQLRADAGRIPGF
jgi:hypothetical protein